MSTYKIPEGIVICIVLFKHTINIIIEETIKNVFNLP
jgi:hypothetical protein